MARFNRSAGYMDDRVEVIVSTPPVQLLQDARRMAGNQNLIRRAILDIQDMTTGPGVLP